MLTLLIEQVIDSVQSGSSGCGWFELKVTIGDILTLLGIIIAVYEYGSNAKSARKQALESQKETWFLNVIVLPQLDGINSFYQDLIKNIITDRETVNSFKEEKFEQCTIKVAELKQTRKQQINDFFDHTIALVMSYDEVLGREVSQIVMSLEDEYVKIIDAFVHKEDANVRASVLQNKQHLIATLNSGIKKEKKEKKEKKMEMDTETETEKKKRRVKKRK